MCDLVGLLYQLCVELGQTGLAIVVENEDGVDHCGSGNRVPRSGLSSFQMTGIVVVISGVRVKNNMRYRQNRQTSDARETSASHRHMLPAMSDATCNVGKARPSSLPFWATGACLL